MNFDSKAVLRNDVDDNVNHKPLKPEILKDWKAKLFILLLCSISFYAGWQSKQSYSNKHCRELGGQIALVNDKSICRLP